MKHTAWLFVVGFCLSSVTYVYTFKCFECDRESPELCKDKPVNCKNDPDFIGLDSCFTYKMAVKTPNVTYIHVIKGCSYIEGCDLLREEMCETSNMTSMEQMESCSVKCCHEHHYCNVMSRPSPSDSTVNADVLGYGASSTSQTTMTLFVPVALITSYLVLGN